MSDIFGIHELPAGGRLTVKDTGEPYLNPRKGGISVRIQPAPGDPWDPVVNLEDEVQAKWMLIILMGGEVLTRDDASFHSDLAMVRGIGWCADELRQRAGSLFSSAPMVVGATDDEARRLRRIAGEFQEEANGIEADARARRDKEGEK